MKIDFLTLAAQPFLRGMAKEKLALLAEDSRLVQFSANETILQQGGLANSFYLILDGQVAVELPVLAGRAISVQTLTKGDTLGWSWLFAPFLWQFDARAIVMTKALFFNGSHLRRLCEENHDLGYDLMKRSAELAVKRLHAARQAMAHQGKILLSPL